MVETSTSADAGPQTPLQRAGSMLVEEIQKMRTPIVHFILSKEREGQSELFVMTSSAIDWYESKELSRVIQATGKRVPGAQISQFNMMALHDELYGKKFIGTEIVAGLNDLWPEPLFGSLAKFNFSFPGGFCGGGESNSPDAFGGGGRRNGGLFSGLAQLAVELVLERF